MTPTILCDTTWVVIDLDTGDRISDPVKTSEEALHELGIVKLKLTRQRIPWSSPR